MMSSNSPPEFIQPWGVYGDLVFRWLEPNLQRHFVEICTRMSPIRFYILLSNAEGSD